MKLFTPKKAYEVEKTFRDIEHFYINSVYSEEGSTELDKCLEELDRDTFQLYCTYFSTEISIQRGVNSCIVECMDQLEDVTPPLRKYTSEDAVDRDITEGLRWIRLKMFKTIGDQMQSKLGKVFSREREWNWKRNKKNNASEIDNRKVYTGSVFESLMTKHRIVYGYDFEAGSFIVRLKKQNSSDVENHDSPDFTAGCVDMIYSLRRYFNDAKKGH